MKISRERLAQLVKEELSISFGGVGDTGGDMGAHDAHVEPEGEGYMAKQNLWKIAEYAAKLYELMEDSDNLEPWVEEKIAIAAFLMDSVGHYIEYAKHREGEGGEGQPDMTSAVDVEMEPEEQDEEEYELDLEPEEYEDEDEEYEDEEEDEDEREER